MHYSVPPDFWYGLICLFGNQNEDWEYYETDPDWWALRSHLRRN